MMTLQFIDDAPKSLPPNVGKLDFKWFTGPASSTMGSSNDSIAGVAVKTRTIGIGTANGNQENPTSNDQSDTSGRGSGPGMVGERDLDVADDDDGWMR